MTVIQPSTPAQTNPAPPASPPPAGGEPAAPEQAAFTSGQALKGGAYTLVGYVITQSLRMGSNIILTRVLDREAFGIMAIVNTFLVGLHLFSDIGIGPSIIQNPRADDPKFLNTAFTLQFGRGVMLFSVAALSAAPVAWFFDAPELRFLVPVAACAALVEGIQSTKYYTVQRHLALGRITLIEIGCQVAGLVVMLIWASIAPSVWALIAGGLTGVVSCVILSYGILPGYTGRFGWDKETAAAMARFGRWIFVSTAITFAVGQADRLIFAKMIPLGLLGVYSIALQVANVPTLAMRSLAGRVIFPLISRAQHSREELASVFRSSRRLHMVISGWALSGLIGGGAAAIRLVYDARYYEAGWMLQVLALAGWFGTPEATNTQAALACGQPRWVAAGNFAKLIGMVLLMPLGFYLGGFPGALLGFAASELLRYAASAVAAYRLGLSAFRQDMGFSLVVLAASFASWLASEALARAGVHTVLQALTVFVVATAVWTPWLWPYIRVFGVRVRRRFFPG